jgi:cytochrome c oxidase subunit 2
VPSLQLVFAHVDTPPEANALHVTVTGHQWWFEAVYPDLNITTANEIHVEADRQVVFTIRSNDVIHSFWVPQMGGKMDMVPIHDNKQIYKPNEAGEYLGQCAELCGVAHANMRFRLIVDSPADFAAWTKRMQAGAQSNFDPAFQAWAQRTQPQGQALSDKAQAGQQAFMSNACVGCHTIADTAAKGVTGPNLSRLGERTTIAAGIRQNDMDHLREWIKDPQTLKPGNLMPTLDLPPDTVDAIATYLESLCDPGHCAGQVNTASATGTTTAGASH